MSRRALPSGEFWVHHLPVRDTAHWPLREAFLAACDASVADLTALRSTGLGPQDGLTAYVPVFNERARLPGFLAHYRRLGVRRFVFVDNASTDGTTAYLAEQPDVDLWRTDASFNAAAFGFIWLGGLIRREGVDRWVVVADADELLVYDGMDEHPLPDLAAHLAAGGHRRLFAPMIDMYADRPIGAVWRLAGADLLAAAPWFDGATSAPGSPYRLRATNRGPFMTGGPRNRVFFGDPAIQRPYLHKFPLVWWHAETAYAQMHEPWPFAENDVPQYGALLHFKLLGDFRLRAAESLSRQQHWRRASEATLYLQAIVAEPERTLTDPAVSRRYDGPRALVAEGLLEPVPWGRPRAGVGRFAPATPVHRHQGNPNWLYWLDTIEDHGPDFPRLHEYRLAAAASLADLVQRTDRGPLPDGALPLVTMLRNERAMLPHWLDHYRRLGVDRFVLIDNASDDGTTDFLAAQPDVDLYWTAASFADALHGCYWVDGLLWTRFRGRWVVHVDADELLVYDGMGRHDLKALTGHLRALGLSRLLAPMLDLYPDGPVEGALGPDAADPLDAAPLFDATADIVTPSPGGELHYGGLWQRTFQEIGLWGPQLTKYPVLFYGEATTYVREHTPSPFRDNAGPVRGRLLHLKVTGGFADKVAAGVAEGQHWNNANLYQAYARILAAHAGRGFRQPFSRRYGGPDSLLETWLMRPLDWPDERAPDEVAREAQAAATNRLFDHWLGRIERDGDAAIAAFRRAAVRACGDLAIVRERPLEAGDVVAVMLVRDELLRLPTTLAHHRRLGVDRFLVIDNGSTDGSRAYLETQPDVDLYATDAPFGPACQGRYWIDGLLRRRAIGHWVLAIDADELFVYDGMDAHGLRALAALLERQGERSVWSPLLDLYPQGPLGAARLLPGADPLALAPMFDAGPERIDVVEGYLDLRGGVRARAVATAPGDVAPLLTKIAFLRYDADVAIVSPHRIWPLPSERVDILARLLHLKLLGDLPARVDAALRAQVHWNESHDYRQYRRLLEREPDPCFVHAGSRRYSGPGALLEAGLMAPIDWSAEIAPAPVRRPARHVEDIRRRAREAARACYIVADVLASAPAVLFTSSTFPDCPLGIASAAPELFADGASLHVIWPTWTLALGDAEALARAVADARALMPGARFVVMAPDDDEHRIVTALGLDAILANGLTCIDETAWFPEPGAGEPRFDAVYNARLDRLKRHELARGVPRLALVYPPSLDDGGDGHAAVRALLPQARLLNHERGGGAYAPLDTDAVRRIVCEAAVGLCLSAVEGCMRAAMEYLLCGRPVVSTRSIGGRARYLVGEHCRIVDDTPEAVAAAVRELADRRFDPAAIRAATLAMVARDRRHVVHEINARVAAIGGPAELLASFAPLVGRFTAFRHAGTLAAEVERALSQADHALGARAALSPGA